MRKRFVFCLVATVCCLAGSAVMAESLGTCTNTGYTFMGGAGKYDQTGRDYFLVGNAAATEPDPDDEMWAFSWLKFDNLPSESVAEAWLSIERTAQPGMTQPSAAQPMDVFVQAVDADVADIMAGDVVEFKENHILPGILATATITEPGIYR